MQQIIVESQIKFISYAGNSPFPSYEKNIYKNLLISDNTILTNPVDYQSGTTILGIVNTNFITLSDSIKFIELFADELIFIKINNSLILKTKHFKYLNKHEPIDIKIANGFQIIDSNGVFVKLSDISEIKVEYVIVNDIE